MTWWANLVWCGLFVLLVRFPRAGVALAAVGLLPRFLTVAGTVGTVWMLRGIGWFSVMAFYAMTLLWPVLLVLLLRRPHRAAQLAGWMIPLAVLEGWGALGSLAGMLTGVLLGAPTFQLRQVSAAMFAIAQVFFLLRMARTS